MGNAYANEQQKVQATPGLERRTALRYGTAIALSLLVPSAIYVYSNKEELSEKWRLRRNRKALEEFVFADYYRAAEIGWRSNQDLIDKLVHRDDIYELCVNPKKKQKVILCKSFLP